MDRIFRRERIIFVIILILISIFSNIFLLGDTKNNDVISASVSANYITLIINNLYIIYMYVKSKKIKNVYDKIICRIKQTNFLNLYTINSIIDILIFQFITYFIIYLKVGINLDYKLLFIVVLGLNITNFFLQEMISTLNFVIKKGEVIFVLPFIMNLSLHYYIIPIIIEKIFVS